MAVSSVNALMPSVSSFLSTRASQAGEGLSSKIVQSAGETDRAVGNQMASGQAAFQDAFKISISDTAKARNTQAGQ